MSMGSSASGSPRKQVRKRKPWTKEETDALEKGMLDHGTDWARIHREYFEVLSQRNPVALKDRARSMRQIKERANEELGVWAEACKTTSK